MRMKNMDLDKNNFLRWYRIYSDAVLTGKITFDEYALLNWLMTTTNPYNGELVENYSSIGQKIRKNPDWVRHIMERLKAKGYIHYDIKQGQKNLSKISTNNYPLSNGTYINIPNKLSDVTSENSQKPTKLSEVAVDSKTTDVSEVSVENTQENENMSEVEPAFPKSFTVNNNEALSEVSNNKNQNKNNNIHNICETIKQRTNKDIPFSSIDPLIEDFGYESVCYQAEGLTKGVKNIPAWLRKACQEKYSHPEDEITHNAPKKEDNSPKSPCCKGGIILRENGRFCSKCLHYLEEAEDGSLIKTETTIHDLI
ncbi:MAG: hypothetical protein A2252_04490 [Elusimicrobia bacterium RIFOXYA2_FULL_39_19]|nr:MAG: hypothetical protein A2252_04490 [Elusimicrobia bacterium RIFOXYA2_FULL_39_19]